MAVSTEVRSVSSTGGEKGVKAERYDLIPVEALDVLARVYAFGAEKYADHNWRKGYEWGKSYAAAMRHMTAFWRGETHDPESGLPHLAHAMFHMAALLTWLEEGGELGEFDDRYRATVPHRLQGYVNAMALAVQRALAGPGAPRDYQGVEQTMSDICRDGAA